MLFANNYLFVSFDCIFSLILFQIIDSYNENGFEFLLKCFNDCDYIEELTGLTQLHNESDLQEVWALSDDE